MVNFSAKVIDHTLLKPEASAAQVRQLCEEAREYGFASVCVNPKFVAMAREELSGSGVLVCTVVGFPLGSNMTSIKATEAKLAVKHGADEIDMVLDIGCLKEGLKGYVEEDIRQVVLAARPAIVKVIFETCLLTDEEKITACQLATEAGAHFVKTSTGFSSAGATIADVELMKKHIGASMQVKASGGIRDLASAEAMLKAGASRLGMSASVAVMQAFKQRKS